MRKMLMILGMCAGLLPAAELPVIERETPAPIAKPSLKLWQTSVAALAAANALDVHSSWGKHELNSTLAGSAGTFGGRGTLLKLGFQGGLVGVEYLITRGHPNGKVMKALSFINFGTAGVIGGVAAHNYTIPRVSR